MPLFKIEREKLKLINERPISLERDLQNKKWGQLYFSQSSHFIQSI